MKKLKSLIAVAMTAVVLTSCLDGGDNKSDFQDYGVISYDSKFNQYMFFTSDEVAYYVPTIANDPNFIGGDECVFAYLHLNFDGPENADATTKGYYTATTSANEYSKLDKYRIASVVTDTVKPLDNELTLRDVAQGGYKKVKDFMFMSLSYQSIVRDQKNLFDLSYDYSKEPVEVNGKRVYDFFLRVTKKEAGTGATIQNANQIVVFDGRSILSQLLRVEKNANAESLNIRINYVKEFDKDTTKITSWGSETIKFDIPKESN